MLLAFWLLGMLLPEIKKAEKQEEKKMKISLKEIPQKVKESGEKEKIVQKPQEVAPPMPKGSQLEKIVEPIKREPIKYKPQNIEQKEKIKQENKEPILPKEEVVKPAFEPLPSSKPYIELPKEQTQKKQDKSKSEDPLAWMNEDKSEQESQQDQKKQSGKNSVGSSDIRELYGDEFGKLTPGQQKYLLDNQEIMRRITQETLNRVASVNLKENINANSVNIVEFYLHPNGDMTDFKFLKKSGYYVLDDTTKETIEYSYSKYPRPSEKILVRYNVFYNLARH